MTGGTLVIENKMYTVERRYMNKRQIVKLSKVVKLCFYGFVPDTCVQVATQTTHFQKIVCGSALWAFNHILGGFSAWESRYVVNFRWLPWWYLDTVFVLALVRKQQVQPLSG